MAVVNWVNPWAPSRYAQIGTRLIEGPEVPAGHVAAASLIIIPWRIVSSYSHDPLPQTPCVDPGTRTAMTAGMWLRVCSRPRFLRDISCYALPKRRFQGCRKPEQ
jgi:hypothetical protein